jgi:hypothetical protein
MHQAPSDLKLLAEKTVQQIHCTLTSSRGYLCVKHPKRLECLFAQTVGPMPQVTNRQRSRSDELPTQAKILTIGALLPDNLDVIKN